jgi:hypothetical protein
MSREFEDARARLAVVGPADAGSACPCCGGVLQENAEIAVCGACSAAHHAGCWRDHGGCAVVGCPCGPAFPGAVRAAAPPSALGSVMPARPASVPAVARSPASWTPQPPAPGGGRGPSLAVAMIVLAIAVVGAAIAIVLASQGSSRIRLVAGASTTGTVTTSGSNTTSGSTATSGSQPEQPGGATGTATSPAAGSLPAVPSEQMQSEIQQVLLQWHEDVVSGDYHAAWELLSARKRAQDGGKYGYSGWVKNQSTLRPYLNPAGLKVSVQGTEPSEGVAQVDVTGMTWSKPGSSCGEWSGITWVKYEAGAWRYDPGYSTTPQREREWKSRFSELLGGRC